MNPSGKSVRAMTLVELLLVIAFLAILAAVFLSSITHPPPGKRVNRANNLKQIGISFQTWVLDNQGNYPMRVSATNGGTMELVESGFVYPHFQVMSNELSTPRVLVCPEDADRSAATNFVPDLRDNKLSYFIGVDATPTMPTAFLAGDRNLAIGGVPTMGLVRLPDNERVSWTRRSHGGCGNILFGDGSVNLRTTAELSAALPAADSTTNRLAIPR